MEKKAPKIHITYVQLLRVQKKKKKKKKGGGISKRALNTKTSTDVFLSKMCILVWCCIHYAGGRKTQVKVRGG